jgi:ABC-type amino acid transport substrate-binding protein
MLRFESLQQQIKTAEAQAAQQVAAAAATGRLAAASRSSGAPTVSSMQQQMYSISNLIAGLMAGLPGQLLLAFVVDLLAFLAQALTWLDEHKCAPLWC